MKFYTKERIKKAFEEYYYNYQIDTKPNAIKACKDMAITLEQDPIISAEWTTNHLIDLMEKNK